MGVKSNHNSSIFNSFLKSDFHSYKFSYGTLVIYAIVLILSSLVISPVIAQSPTFNNTSDSIKIDSVEDLRTHEVDFKAVALLPFFSNYLDDGLTPSSKRQERMREISIENMMGFRWAAERLKQSGYLIDLTFLDEVPDTLGKSNWDVLDIYGSDVVFGPLQISSIVKSIRIIENLGADHVLLTPVNENLLKSSDAIRCIIPSEKFAVDLIAVDIAKNHSDSHIIFVMADGVDSDLESRFMDELSKQLLVASPIQDTTSAFDYITPISDTLRFDTVHGSKNSVGSLSEKIKFYERNVVVTVAGRSARSMLSNLQMAVQINDSTEIYVYSHPELQGLGFIDVKFLERSRTTIPVSEVIDWNDSTSIAAVKVFRKMYKSDPSKYSLRAHDAFLDAFLRKKKKEMGDLDFSILPAQISTKYDWGAVDTFSGYINKAWKLKTFHLGQWCDSDTVPMLPDFLVPELDDDGFYINKP
ncbi:MAG: hypothetical protein COA49_09990 [Bacteroidetes bacterium]|nr:MAG: hypothetical protein COA49_09990 [Bacteroidota bacterium]